MNAHHLHLLFLLCRQEVLQYSVSIRVGRSRPAGYGVVIGVCTERCGGEGRVKVKGGYVEGDGLAVLLRPFCEDHGRVVHRIVE